MIPNIVHFVWLTGPKSRDFSFINQLAVRAAHDVMAPDVIFMHVNEEPVGNPNWDRIRPYVTVLTVTPPENHKGVAIEYPQYQADILRLEILLEHGGIYLDTDMLLLKPITAFMDRECLLTPDDVTSPLGINAGIIGAVPNAPFIRKWLEAFKITETWAYGAVALPWALYHEDPSVFPLASAEDFIPFDWRDKSILENGTVDAYSVHMWETIWVEDLKNVNDQYLRCSKSTFAKLFKRFAKPLKICVYAISKNEEMFVERFCASAADADTILIADTGSTDNTIALAKKCGAYVLEIFISPWRFDLARNAALALIPRDTDICVSLDLDEELQPGWREEIERVWYDGATRLRYKFDWGAGIAFFYEKIHARHGYKWHHPCHEYPVPDRIEEKWAHTDMLLVIHKPDPTKSRGQYLDLLRVSIEEDPQDPRNAFYYARELSFHAQWQEAIDACKSYLALPKATWNNERCYAMRVIARCYNEMGNKDEALNWARRAISEAPDTREPWCETATIAYQMGRWAECYGAALSALAIHNRELVYTVDPEVWGAQPHDLAAIAAWNLGFKEKALEHAQNAWQMAPENERLLGNLAFIQSQLPQSQ